jgi:hypothetical protein
MLVVVNFLHQQILARLKVHDVHVEVILRGGWQQFTERENLRRYGDEWLRVGGPKQQLWAASIHDASHSTTGLDVSLFVHQHNGATPDGRKTARQCGSERHSRSDVQSLLASHLCSCEGGKYAKSSAFRVRCSVPAAACTSPSMTNTNLRKLLSKLSLEHGQASTCAHLSTPGSGAAD